MRRHVAREHLQGDLRELFARMIFNIFVSNDDDHLRNHGFVLTPKGWRLAPLYDVVPHPSVGSERFQNLGVGTQGRLATVPNAMSQHGVFGLTQDGAREVIDKISTSVRQWKNTFERCSVPGTSIDAVSSAMRRLKEISN